MRSLECYFGVYFPRCCATQEINTKITLSWAHKQFATRVHTLFYISWRQTGNESSPEPIITKICDSTRAQSVNSLASRKCSLVIVSLISRTDNLAFPVKLPWGECHKISGASSHYRNRCWPRSLIPCGINRPKSVNTWRPRQSGRHFADDILKCNFLNGNVWIPIKISLKFVSKGPINNIPALVQIMAWRRPGDKPLSEPMLVSLLTHICVTRPQWVKLINSLRWLWCGYSGITKWIKKWKKNGWKLASGDPVVNREDFEELDAELPGINVTWVRRAGGPVGKKDTRQEQKQSNRNLQNFEGLIFSSSWLLIHITCEMEDVVDRAKIPCQ